jgi:hypothetical protein
MTRSSSKHRSRTALTRRDMPARRARASAGPAQRGTGGATWRSGSVMQSSSRRVGGAADCCAVEGLAL